MNAVQLRDRVRFYNDDTRTGRQPLTAFEKAVNDAIGNFTNDIVNQGPQYIQQNRDNISTLFTVATPAITNGTVITSRYGASIPMTFTKPTDYRAFSALRMIVDGISTPVHPADNNEISEFMENLHTMPSNTQAYCIENSTGFTIYRGSTATVTVSLTYIKKPATYSLGTEGQKISAGAGVLVNGQTYIALEDDTVQNGVTYKSGDSFVAVGTNLTAGQVILSSNTTPCDLPDKTHDIIARMASTYMLIAIGEGQKAALVDKGIPKS